jgi:hypothetical protein
METPLSWEQQEVFRLLKAQPGTAYQESTKQAGTFLETGCAACWM